MVKNNDLSGYRILIIAIAISFAWHVFWLSAVKIVSSPIHKEAIRFSKVSFLGPILSRVNMEVRATPAIRSLLEKRYQKIAGAAFYKESEIATGASLKYYGEAALRQANARLSSVIDDAVSADKLEPDYPAE